jgi:alpha-D-ribose 1-methylphosphonate 5-triphosphate synthase subunit PhnH
MLDLTAIAPGFGDTTLESQAVFRRALAALAQPGLLVECDDAPEPPPGVHPAANALLLALLDHDCRLWLSPSLNGVVAGYLRFHTGCVLVGAPQYADFALVARAAELPRLDSFDGGSDEFPERGATVVVQLEALGGAGFLAQWSDNGAQFPRGVDLFLASGKRLCGLPRTTRIEA